MVNIQKNASVSLDSSVVIEGDAVLSLKRIPSDSVQCIVTSPPYWGMRDYGVKGQIGLEGKLQQYCSLNVCCEV